MSPFLSVIVLLPDASGGPCLAALADAAPAVGFEVVVVASSSASTTTSSLEGAVTVVPWEDGASAGAALDAGAAVARGEYLFLVDSSVRLEEGWYEPLAACLSDDPTVGAVQPRLVDEHGHLVHAGGEVGGDGTFAVRGAGTPFADAPAFMYRREPDFVSLRCLLLRTAAYPAAGAAQGPFSADSARDVDFSFSLRASGWRLAYEPVRPVRVVGATAAPGGRVGPADVERLAARWPAPVAPAGDAQLSLLAVDAHVPLDTPARLRFLAELRRSGYRVATHLLNGSGRDRWAAELAALGIPCFGPDPADQPDDPAEAAAWRKAFGAALPGVLVRDGFDTVLFGDSETATQAMAAVRTFAPEATVVVDAAWVTGGGRVPRAEELMILGQADRVLAASDGAAELRRALPGSEILEVPAPAADDGRYGDAVRAAAAPAPAVEPCIPALDPDRPVDPGMVSIVIPVWNRLDLTKPCVESLRNYSRQPYEVIVVDNGSTDGTAEWLARQRDLVVITNPENRGFAAACNQGIAAARGEWVVLLNNDTRVPRRWLDGLVGDSIPADAGAVGPRSNSVSGSQVVPDSRYRTNSEFVRWAEDWRRRHRGSVWETQRLVGFCLALRREALDAVGGLDEAFGPGNFEDDDLCLRFRGAGWRLLVADEVFVHHEGHASFGGMIFGAMGRGLRHFQRKYAGLDRAAETPYLSACLIVKDEEERLPDCLISLRGLVDEVVVVDTGSSDSTRDLAAAAGCRVLDVPWRDDFAHARNASLEAARGEWAFVIDADERAVFTDAAGLRSALTGTTLDVLRILIRSDVAGTGALVEHHLERMFRTAKIRFRGRLHEQVYRLDGQPMEFGLLESLHLDHIGYRPEVFAERDKGTRNERIARAHYETGDTQSFYRSFVLARAASDAAEKARCFREAIDAIPAKETGYLIQALCGLGLALLELGEPEEALRTAQQALEVAPGLDTALLQAGKALNDLGRHQEAKAILADVADSRAGGDILATDSTIRTVFIPVERGRAECSLGNHEAAVASLLPVAELTPATFPAWPMLLESLRQIDGAGWLDRVEKVAGAAPLVLVTATATGVPPAVRLELLERLAESHLSLVEAAFPIFQTIPFVEDAAVAAAATERWLARIQAFPPESQAHMARRLEESSPAAALRIWQHLGAGHDASLGRLRCHVALRELPAALEALGGVALDRLTPPDVVFLAAFVLEIGDAETAGGLLDALPAGMPGIPVDEALTVAGAVGPDCLERTRRRLVRSVA